MKTAFGQTLVATFRESLFACLQTSQNAAISRRHCRTVPLYIFNAGKLIAFSLSPANQPLPGDLLTGRIQSLEALYHATPPIFTLQGIGAVLLDFSLALHFRYLPGSTLTRDRHATEGRHRGRFTGPSSMLSRLTGYSGYREVELRYTPPVSDR